MGLEIVGHGELDGMGGDHRQPQRRGQRHRRAHVGFVVRQSGVLQLEVEALREHGGEPGGDRLGAPGVAAEQGLADRAEVGAGQGDQAAGQLFQPRPLQLRLGPLQVASPGSGEQLRQVEVAAAVLDQQQQAGGLLLAFQRFHPDVGAEDRLDALAARRLVELDRAEQVVEIGDRAGALPVLPGGGDRVVDAQGAVDDGVFGVGAQMDEGHAGIVGSGEGPVGPRRVPRMSAVISPVSPVLNVSAYHFVPLDALPERRARLQAAAEAARLRGTLLLAPEGINLFLAGEPAALNAFMDGLRAEPCFAGLEAKASWSETVPFRRLRVKCKAEIIRMDMPSIRPATGRAPSVDASTLARWLDQGHDDTGRPVVMLDTRNGFEVDAGHFDGALDWRLDRFGAFPQALRAHRAELEGRTVVSYCTGGIRCEKAALLMRDEGVETVYQLDGGILKYLEQTDGRHWRGGCFVFDERETLDSTLRANTAGKG